MNENEKVINAENLNIYSTLENIPKELGDGRTLILDIGNNFFRQTDELYAALVQRGYNAKKTFRDGRNQIILSKKQ